MKKTKITFLMTAHNSERVIADSIESVLCQSEPSITLIIRNNGSSDRTGEICMSYQKKDSRVVYLENKTNWLTDQGVGYQDRGWWPELQSDYVSVIDHDDLLHKDFSKLMYQAAKRENAQIVACGRNHFDSQTGQIIRQDIPIPICTHDLTRDLNANFPYLYTPVCRTIWGKLYQTDFYEKYYEEVRQFPDGLYLSTDTWIVLGYLEKAKSFAALDLPLYDYRLNQKSGFYTAVLDSSRIREGEILYERGRKFLESLKIDTKENLFFLKRLYWGHMKNLIYILEDSEAMSLEEKLSYLQEILKQERAIEYCGLNFSEVFSDLDPLISGWLYHSGSKIDEKRRSSLLRFYLVRIWDGLFQKKKNRLAYCMLLSGIYAEDNIGRFGLPLAEEHWENISESEACFSRLGKDKKAEIKNALHLVDFLYGKNDREALARLEEALISALECEDFEAGGDCLEKLSAVFPEDKCALYYRIYLLMLAGEKTMAARLAYAARAIYAEDDEMKALCGFALELVEN